MAYPAAAASRALTGAGGGGGSDPVLEYVLLMSPLVAGHLLFSPTALERARNAIAVARRRPHASALNALLSSWRAEWLTIDALALSARNLTDRRHWVWITHLFVHATEEHLVHNVMGLLLQGFKLFSALSDPFRVGGGRREAMMMIYALFFGGGVAAAVQGSLKHEQLKAALLVSFGLGLRERWNSVEQSGHVKKASRVVDNVKDWLFSTSQASKETNYGGPDSQSNAVGVVDVALAHDAFANAKGSSSARGTGGGGSGGAIGANAIVARGISDNTSDSAAASSRVEGGADTCTESVGSVLSDTLSQATAAASSSTASRAIASWGIKDTISRWVNRIGDGIITTVHHNVHYMGSSGAVYSLAGANLAVLFFGNDGDAADYEYRQQLDWSQWLLLRFPDLLWSSSLLAHVAQEYLLMTTGDHSWVDHAGHLQGAGFGFLFTSIVLLIRRNRRKVERERRDGVNAGHRLAGDDRSGSTTDSSGDRRYPVPPRNPVNPRFGATTAGTQAAVSTVRRRNRSSVGHNDVSDTPQ